MDIQTKNKLLEKIISFAIKTFENSDDAKKYLSDKLISDSNIYSKNRIGYCNGSLIKALPKKGKILDDLTELNIIKNETEYFDSHIILPITDSENNIKNIVGIDINNSEEKYLFTDGEQLFNLPIINIFTEVFQVGNILDLLSCEVCGINNVITGKAKLNDNEIKVKVIDININDILINNGIEAVEKAVSDSMNHGTHRDSDNGIENAGIRNPTVNHTLNGFITTYGLRAYEIIGLEKAKRKLKATVKINKNGRIHVDTIDFYSSKQRRQLQLDICNQLDELPQAIEQDINKILQLCEQHTPNNDNSVPITTGTQISQADNDVALNFGRNKNLINEILADYEKIGFVGSSENSNKLLCYLSATSRKMGERNVLSVIILSSSGAGKSKLQDSTLSLMPEEDVIKVTNLSGKALFYKERSSLKNKILALEECKATNKEADYAIRTLISSGQLISEVTIRDTNGKMTTQQNIIDAGATSVFFTSTNPNQNSETASRFFTIGINESEEQTKDILKYQMEQFSLEGLVISSEVEAIKNKHKNFQRLLKSYKVVNPYKIKFSDTRLQARRLFPQILNLINAVCFLRQMQKDIKRHGEIEYIEVDKKDIQIAVDLAKNILSKSLNELSDTAITLLNKIDKYLEEQKRLYAKKNKNEIISKGNISFSRKDLRYNIKWSNSRLKTFLNELINLEYVILEGNRTNKLQQFKLLYDSKGQLALLNNIANIIRIE